MSASCCAAGKLERPSTESDSLRMAVTFIFRKSNRSPQSPDSPGTLMPARYGRAVILIHGLTGTPIEMRFLAWFLNTHGFTTACPRLANHGQPMHVLTLTRWEAFYVSVWLLYEELAKDLDEIYV